MTTFGDFTTMTFLIPGLIPLIGAAVASVGMTTRSQNGQVSVELRRAGILLLPNLAAFWHMGFTMGLFPPLLAVLTFAFCATDGLPFGKILTTTAASTRDAIVRVERRVKRPQMERTGGIMNAVGSAGQAWKQPGKIDRILGVQKEVAEKVKSTVSTPESRRAAMKMTVTNK